MALGAFFGILWYCATRANRDPVLRQQYPFDDPNFIHVGINPAQAQALKPLEAELRFLQWLPRHDNPAVDAVFYAMTREEFISFFGTLSKHARILIADAAKKQEAFLRGDAFTLYDMLIGLTEVRRRIAPELRADEFVMPLAATVDSVPA
ncbi:MAG: hypothetical protein AB7P97_20435 [Hyphomonadaceae bacterium]